MTLTSLLSRGWEGQVAGYVLVLARLSPLFLVAPLFSSKMVPARVRGVVAVALAVGLAPLAVGSRRVPLETLPLAGLIGKELLVGLAFAFCVQALFAAVTAAGSLLDTLVGFAIGQLVDPLTGNQGTILAQIYGLVAVMIFIAIGGDALLIQGVARTYDLVPLLRYPDLGVLVAGVLTAFTSILTSAVEVAAPVMVAVMLTDVAFGVVSRVVPQLNIFAVDFPAKVLVGVAVIGASLPFAASWLAGGLTGSVVHALGSLREAHP